MSCRSCSTCLRGEMSLIGPRPERPEFVSVLAEQIAGYEDRLTVMPGVTGLAQINLPPDTDLNSVRRKQSLDVEYIRTASLGMDVRILMCTLLRIVGVKGETAMRWMRLRREVELPELDETPGEATSDETKAAIDARGAARDPEVERRRHEDFAPRRVGQVLQRGPPQIQRVRLAGYSGAQRLGSC